jgi:hypothetical protein
MSLNVRHLDWLRKLDVPSIPGFGARMHELVTDIINGTNVIESQTNSDAGGRPAPPSAIQGVRIIPHPQGVDIAIQHDGEFYEGVHYLVDYSPTPNFQGARTQDIGSSRNHVFPIGQWNGYYQVRAKYPTGQSTAPVIFGGPTPTLVRGGSASAVSLLPNQGAGTTSAGQPPGFGGAYRSQTGAPPVRGSK